MKRNWADIKVFLVVVPTLSKVLLRAEIVLKHHSEIFLKVVHQGRMVEEANVFFAVHIGFSLYVFGV